MTDTSLQVLCDYCHEPITRELPGSNWTMRNEDASEFPYNGAPFLVVAHTFDGLSDCLLDWVDDQPGRVSGEWDSPIEVHP